MVVAKRYQRLPQHLPQAYEDMVGRGREQQKQGVREMKSETSYNNQHHGVSIPRLATARLIKIRETARYVLQVIIVCVL
jgi:hypothetical protein